MRDTDLKSFVEDKLSECVTREVGKIAVEHKDAMLEHNKRLMSLEERVEEQEARALSPGRTGAGRTREREYTEIFVKNVRCAFKDPGLLMELENAQRALERRDVTIGSSAGGGYAVPEQISREVGRLELLFSPVRSLVKVVRAGTSDYKELVSKRGTTSGWVGETGTRSATATSQHPQRAPTNAEL
jgi:HK97 family phage major capsid protein